MIWKIIELQEKQTPRCSVSGWDLKCKQAKPHPAA